MAKVRGVFSGKAGNVVFVRHGDGFYVRARVAGADPKTDAQRRVREAHAKATRAWKTLPPEQAAQWRQLAQDLHTRQTGLQSAPPGGAAYRLFVDCARRRFRFDPTADVPTPPGSLSLRDASVPITVEAVGTPQAPRILFTAQRPLPPALAAELQLQSIGAAWSQPTPSHFRFAAFAEFREGETTVTVAPPRGWKPGDSVACVVRFFLVENGLAGDAQAMGTVGW